MSIKFPDELRIFIESVEWIFAVTYAKTWPHYYIVKDRVDEELFVRMVVHIREKGYMGTFYHKRITYFEEDGLVYWTMVPPIDDPGWYPVEEETIINRCPKESTYEHRLKMGTLPK
ncbi:MAG: hypothetical protein MIO92_13005 [Methanosarcinaceae archaeon]|nr:hypothetical protein [Methanosarcinaceae archaeon]